MLKIGIATKSLDKVNGIKDAISRLFCMNEKEIAFYSIQTQSGVSEQPFGDETYQGALNRLKYIKNELPNMDLYISCEAGIECSFKQYFNVQIVCIEKDAKIFWGKSSGWSIPSEDIELIQKNNLDIYLKEKGISSIEELLGSSHSRSAAVAQATELALASGKLKNN